MVSEIVSAHDKFIRMMVGRQTQGHFGALGIDMMGCGEHWAEMRLTPKPELIGDPISGALHTGPITTLLDSALGIAASVSLPKMGFAPTIDLRVDHLRKANAEEVLVARGEVVRITRNVLFSKGSVTQGGVVIASAVGNFVRLSDEMLAAAEAHILKQLAALEVAK